MRSDFSNRSKEWSLFAPVPQQGPDGTSPFDLVAASDNRIHISGLAHKIQIGRAFGNFVVSEIDMFIQKCDRIWANGSTVEFRHSILSFTPKISS
jgi:hypothetical protein